jgi:3-oxoacyl-[acyl-carrier protein] reductase
MELKGKVAITTGAGLGIGRAIALELAKAGATLVLADIREDAAEKVKEEIQGMGKEALVIQMDVSKWEDVEGMVKTVMERFGRIDILVNNAGISPKGKGGVPLKFLDIDGDHWDTVMNVNLKGAFNCSKAVVPFMIRQSSGKIVNIGSIVGLTGGAGSPASVAYFVSKAGVHCLTKALARELAQYNINVNTIAPGRILTEIAKSTSPEVNEGIRRQTPLGRFGEPIDVARAAVFLISEAGNFITGATLVVDGGRTMH